MIDDTYLGIGTLVFLGMFLYIWAARRDIPDACRMRRDHPTRICLMCILSISGILTVIIAERISDIMTLAILAYHMLFFASCIQKTYAEHKAAHAGVMK